VNHPRFAETGTGPLAFEIFGNPRASRKAIFFHGHPGSLAQGGLIHDAAQKAGFTVAAFDRPGFGHSALFKASPGNPLDLSSALLALADELGWQEFHLIAVSGGAPYALNSVPGLGKRALSVTLVCGLGPLAEPEIRRAFPRGPYRALRIVALIPEPILSLAVKIALKALSNPRANAGRGRMAFLSKSDRALLQGNQAGKALKASLEGAFRQGAKGAQRDQRAYLTPWKVNLSKLSCPVTLWHGGEDRLVPSSTSEWLAKRIPGSKLHLLKSEGHYTLPLTRSDEILQNLAREADLRRK
jgi:pimeloyl-ACP methyl ester carboxylesterase